jgi:hypothetical protein
LKNALLIAFALLIGMAPATYAVAHEPAATSSETMKIKPVKKAPMKHERHSKFRVHHKVIG